jgi:hypothetical protein
MGFTGSSGTCRPCGQSPSARHRHDAEASRAVGKGKSGRRRGSCGLRHRPPRPWPPAPAGAGPRGSADRAARSPVKMNVRAPRDLGAVCPDDHPVRAARPRGRASSRGVVQRTPLHRTVGEATPGGLPRLRDAATSRILVPPSWFLTTSTVSSSSTVRACCIPLPILGFTAFPPRSRRPVSRLPADGASPRCLPALRSLDPRRQRRLRAPHEVALAWVVEPRGGVTAGAVAGPCVHRAPLPS